ncbi:hypothetical protein AB1484_06240 [Parafrankia sp. FMc6]|uniref:phosphotransferase-like protein n=1 Tax=Parafrankia soli TaxID=2599596 RepID=UPI0034D49C9B
MHLDHVSARSARHVTDPGERRRLAAAGNDMVVEHVIEFPDWRRELAQLLEGLDVFLVGVHCELAELERRERLRGDRRVGEGRSHLEVDLIHAFGPYDLDVDTTGGVDPTLVEAVLTSWRARSGPSALTANGW